MIKNIKVYYKYKLANLSIINVGGEVDFYYEVNCLESLIKLVKILHKLNKKIIVISNATNMVFKDEYTNTVAIKINAKQIKIHGDFLYVEAGVSIPYLSKYLTNNSYSGFEKIGDIPGLIGGTIVNNSSSFNQAISDNLLLVNVVDFNGNYKTYFKNELGFSYHSSILKKAKN